MEKIVPVPSAQKYKDGKDPFLDHSELDSRLVTLYNVHLRK